jgi:hypothetical protein
VKIEGTVDQLEREVFRALSEWKGTEIREKTSVEGMPSEVCESGVGEIIKGSTVDSVIVQQCEKRKGARGGETADHQLRGG